MRLKLLAIIPVLSMTVVGTAHAVPVEDPNTVCAAIYPCDDSGKVFAPFNQGACKDYYELICSKTALQKCQSSLNPVTDDLQKLQSENATLSKKILRLQRKISSRSSKK